MGEKISTADATHVACLLSHKADYNVTFSNNGETIGRMDWNDGVMKISSELFLNVRPDYHMSFHKDGGKAIGRLDWNDGVMKFTGNAEESAKIFFDFLKPMMDSYMERTPK